MVSLKYLDIYYFTSGFSTTHVVVSVRHPLTYQSPHHLPTSQIRLTARIASIHALIHAIFLLMVRRIQMFFSLEPSLSQGESSLKISARWVRRFGGVREQTNKQTNKQTDRLTSIWITTKGGWCIILFT